MELLLGTFPVDAVGFGTPAGWRAGRLTVDPSRVRELVLDDPRIRSVVVEVVEPGEATRIVQMRDIVEPRVKVRGRGHVYPAIAGHPADTVGDGRDPAILGLRGHALLGGAASHPARGECGD